MNHTHLNPYQSHLHSPAKVTFYLQVSDQRLGKLADWVARNNITVVKLDSTQKIGYEDVFPSFIAISWHGQDYNAPLRDRTRVCSEFVDFVETLRYRLLFLM